MEADFSLTLLDCPVCGRTAAIATKGCSERRFRAYCTGLIALPAPSCTRITDWLFSPEAVQAAWNNDKDVPLPLFPEIPTDPLQPGFAT